MTQENSGSIFLEQVGSNPKMMILEFFIEGRNLDYASSDVIKNVSISKSTFYSVWKELLQQGYIIRTRIVGKTKLYTLNTKNHFVEYFIKIFDEAITKELERIGKASLKTAATSKFENLIKYLGRKEIIYEVKRSYLDGARCSSLTPA